MEHRSPPEAGSAPLTSGLPVVLERELRRGTGCRPRGPRASSRSMANRPLAPIRLIALLALAAPSMGGALPLERIKLPPGFRIDVYAEHVKDARSLALGAQGVVFVGTRRAGRVYALVDGKKQNRADHVVTIASGLDMPNGVAFRDGALYVAELSRVIRYDDI